MIRVAFSLLLFFVTATIVDAQELGFPAFDESNVEQAAGENFTNASYSANNRTSGNVQPNDPRLQSSMLGGFFQFLTLMAIAGVALVGWIIYRKKHREQNEYMRDNWG